MRSISPTTSLLVVFFYSFTVALQEHIYIFMFLPVLFLIFVDFCALKEAFQKLLFLNIFVIIIVISLLMQGDFKSALLIFVRSNLILLATLLLFYQKNEFDIALALQRLRFSHKLVSIVFFTARSIFLIKREFTLFKKTLYIRGFKPKTDFLSYKIMAGFVGILIIKAYERAKYLQKSMFLRGFKGEIYALSKRQVFSRCDIVLCLITLISLTCRWGVVL
ncbi:MAG: energy-coupling factor transporter transmembrane protein EcfT [Campylobacteraceae bacterium]|jgi:cobalt/nickel transport system permease protein|nr:energy-coupling factor transporter transmembrane protein EcfT [Campylobacteraceae bacterium]